MSIAIVPYTERFKDAVRDFVLGIQQGEFGVAITYDDQPDLKNIPGIYQKNGGNFWLALDGEHLIGTTALIDAGNGNGILRKMFVTKEYRGASYGIGQQLFDTLLAWAEAHSICDIYLGTIVERFTSGVRFYEKNGFVAIEDSELPECVTRIKMPLDNRHYRKPLRARKEQAA